MDKDIYYDLPTKYKLSKEEISKIDEVWKFLNIINKNYIFLSDYRNEIITKIREEYTAQEFYELENILNKMFWYLKELDNSTIDYEIYKKDTDISSIKYMMKLFYRSFINKLIIYDTKKELIYVRNMEGSSNIFEKDDTSEANIKIWEILSSRELFERTIKNKKIPKNLILPEYYFQKDYPFPNLNLSIYEFGSYDQKLNRIKKMYYYDGDKKDKFWFKLIHV
jgi:hypothetical protein